MRRAPIIAVVAALVILTVVALTTGSTAARVIGPAPQTSPVTSTTLVCPGVMGPAAGSTAQTTTADVAGALTPPSTSTGVVTSTPLVGKTRPVTHLHLAPSVTVTRPGAAARPLAVSAAGSVAATVAADQLVEVGSGRTRGLSSARCESPAIDWWFVGADGRVGFSDQLELANPAATPANVTVSLWGAKGPLTATRLTSLRVPAASVMHLAIASNAPDDATVTIHVHASSGAVTAAVFAHWYSGLFSNGSDFIPATVAPSRSQVVAGFAPGTGSRYLLLTDPGTVDAMVNLHVVTSAGSFIPAGLNQVVVRAGHAVRVALTKVLSGSTAGVTVTSDVRVVAGGISVIPSPPHRPDFMWVSATPPLQGPAPIATGREPDGGRTLLYLSAPRGAAQVRVSTPGGRTATIRVGAGRSAVADITAVLRTAPGARSFVVTPIGGQPVYGVRVLQFGGGPHGALITGEPLLALPKPILLPPVREDPNAAVRGGRR